MSGGRRILIVEDDADISMVEEAYLEAAGFQTVIVTDNIKRKEAILNNVGGIGNE